MPLGERALGMGGAFTGLANDPSSVFYNPAGLARLEDLALSASLTLNAFDRQRIKNGLQTQEGKVDLAHTSRPTLPGFASVVKQIGWREGDARRHAIGIATLTLNRRRISLDGSIDGQSADQRKVNALSVYDERSVRWYGVSYAYRVSRALSFGVSSFLSIGRINHAEESLDVLLEGPGEMAGTYNNSAVVSRSTRARTNVKNAVFRLGVLYAISARLKFGAMFQPPTFRIRGKGSWNERTVSAVALPQDQSAIYVGDEQDGLSAHDPLPWELRVGTSWAPNYRLMFALDVSVNGRRGSRKDPVVTLKRREAEGDQDLLEVGDFFLETWYGKRTGNVAWGVEYRIRDLIILRSGLFTDLSGAPNVPKTSDIYRPSDVNRLGATLSVGVLTRGYDFSLGATTTVGWGNTLALAPDAVDSRYVRTTMREETLFVFLSGARSAAGKLAEDAYKRVRDKLKQFREDEEDP